MRHLRWLALLMVFAASTGVAVAAETADQKALRARQAGLSRAYARRDMQGTLGFVHPTYTLKMKHMEDSYAHLKAQLPDHFKDLKQRGIRESSRITRVEVQGATGTVVSTTTETIPGRGKATVKWLTTWKKIDDRWMLVKQVEI